MLENQLVIAQTKRWIKEIVIGCNFCPFAAKEIKQNTIHFEVDHSTKMKETVKIFLNECIRLDENENIETSLLIIPGSFKRFDDYLDLVFHAENLLKKKKYTGIYQVASFHPEYLFSGSTLDDPANFTNRSPYPMLHILREESVEKALSNFPNPEKIPANNINFTREKGFAYMKMLYDACLKS